MKGLNYIFCLTLFLSPSFLEAQSMDLQLLSKVNQQPRSWQTTMEFISESTVPLSFLAPSATLTIAAIKKEKSDALKALYILQCLGANGAATYSLKLAFNRDRPYETHSSIINSGVQTSRSMPSGHTSQAFSAATALTLAYPKWYIALPGYLWAGSVGYSRMYNGVHYPSDVIVGAIVGTGTACVTAWLNKQIFDTYQSPVDY